MIWDCCGQFCDGDYYKPIRIHASPLLFPPHWACLPYSQVSSTGKQVQASIAIVGTGRNLIVMHG